MTKPSWQDYGTYDESEHARLWDGVVGAWCPSLGPTGSRLHDHSRFNNWGTLTNMDNATDWVVDGGQYALDFDGSNDYVTIPDSRAFFSGQQLSVSCWVKRNTTGVTYELVNKWLSTQTSNEDGYLFRWFNDNKLRFSIANGGTNYGQFQATTANTSIEWNHVAVVHEFGTTGKTALYLNGTAIAASWTSGGTQVPDSDATNSPINFGTLRYQGGPFNFLAGQLDDVQIRSRIMTANEVRDLYLLGRGGMFERRRRSRRRAIEQAAGFKAYWVRQKSQIIGGGV